MQGLSRSGWINGEEPAAFIGELLESSGIQLIGVEAERIAGRCGFDCIGSENSTQS